MTPIQQSQHNSHTFNQQQYTKVINPPKYREVPPESCLLQNTPTHSPRTNLFPAMPNDNPTSINRKLAASLACQNLPKCHPEIFSGDLTLFHPWQSSFHAMIRDAEVSLAEELNYLRNYNKGKAQTILNSYR